MQTRRYSYLSGTLPERRAPHDSIISDVKIPKGTDVAVSVHGACRDTAVYGPDVDVFRPQRWLEADEQQWQAMEKATFVFLHGKRNCIGRHLAWIEMKKVVATLILSFKVRLDPRHPRGTRETCLLTLVFTPPPPSDDFGGTSCELLQRAYCQDS